MICRHELYHFTVANQVLPPGVSGSVKWILLTVKHTIYDCKLFHSGKKHFDKLNKFASSCFQGYVHRR